MRHAISYVRAYCISLGCISRCRRCPAAGKARRIWTRPPRRLIALGVLTETDRDARQRPISVLTLIDSAASTRRPDQEAPTTALVKRQRRSTTPRPVWPSVRAPAGLRTAGRSPMT
jgi:hypothetical protein